MASSRRPSPGKAHRRLSYNPPETGSCEFSNVFRRRLSLSLMDGEEDGGGERKTSLTGEAQDLDFLTELKEQALEPLKEDLSEWLNKTLGVEISSETFMNVLDSGVQVCKLARLIESKAKEAYDTGQCKEPPPSTRRMQFKANAKSGTWFARDNIANFIHWCQDYGVKKECLFETEGLALHKETRSVVLCLLELARLGSKYGLEPPSIIKLETEIEKEEKQSNGFQALPTKQCALVPSASKASSGKQRRPSSAKSDDLDKSVKHVAGQCTCPENPFNVVRLAEGKYNIGGKSMFVRLLKGQHLMVRVGGGWDTLGHYLTTHDPCKIKEFRRSVDSGKYLQIKGKYGRKQSAPASLS